VSDLRRRRFLLGAATVMGAAAGLVATGGSEADAQQRSGDPLAGSAGSSADRLVPFFGAHQAGILDPPARSTATVALDLTCDTRTELVETMRTLTERAAFLTGGGTPANVGISGPSPDSGTLGPVVPAGGLKVTVGLGASAFDDRFGLSADRPGMLRAMDTFPNDTLDRAQCDGDVLLQLGADDQDTVLHALRDLTRNTRGAMQIRWRVDGFTPRSRPTGAPRNLLGFKDGTANPDATDPALMAALVWVQAGSGEPSWAVGGTYHVVRIIRMLVEFWDRVTVDEQERMIGRRKDSGAPLSGSVEADLPDYGNDPLGAAIPLDAHIRLANPRTAQTDRSRVLRRGFSYDRGTDLNGNLDQGLVFTCFQQDLDRQFVAVQRRLADEPLVDYISPVGGGYFFALPGISGPGDYYARALLG
jgi:deferrochelatase/peroxidase EfeB